MGKSLKDSPGVAAKLPQLPKGSKIQKRPLLHPPVPSPRTSSSSEKVIYLSTKTPFMAAVKRVRALLVHVEKRSTQSELRLARGTHRRGRGGIEGNSRNVNTDQATRPSAKAIRSESVVIKATGKAVEKALAVALFLLEMGDLQVKIATGSVGAIDDIVVQDEAVAEVLEPTKIAQAQSETAQDDRQKIIDSTEQMINDSSPIRPGDQPTKSEEIPYVPESRIRNLSVIEISVSLKS